MNAVKAGNIAIGNPAGAAATVFPEMGAFLVPYLVRSYDHAYAMFNAASRKMVKSASLTEVCGLAPDGTGFLVSAGTGKIVTPDGVETRDAERVWDNHLLRIERRLS